ncbi:MAG: hypothetical protein ABIF77_07070, partial [bacterium]
ANITNPALMSKFVQGNLLLTESLLHKLRGDPERGLQFLRQACRVNPEDREFPFLIQLDY